MKQKGLLAKWIFVGDPSPIGMNWWNHFLTSTISDTWTSIAPSHLTPDESLSPLSSDRKRALLSYNIVTCPALLS